MVTIDSSQRLHGHLLHRHLRQPPRQWPERIARIETKMDFVATHKDLAAVHTEIAKTDARIADLKVEVLKEMGGVKTLIANREASMQRWLLGITATTVVGVSTALVGVTTALIRTLA